jgi:hypothetical protein
MLFEHFPFNLLFRSKASPILDTNRVHDIYSFGLTFWRKTFLNHFLVHSTGLLRRGKSVCAKFASSVDTALLQQRQILQLQLPGLNGL